MAVITMGESLRSLVGRGVLPAMPVDVAAISFTTNFPPCRASRSPREQPRRGLRLSTIQFLADLREARSVICLSLFNPHRVSQRHGWFGEENINSH